MKYPFYLNLSLPKVRKHLVECYLADRASDWRMFGELWSLLQGSICSFQLERGRGHL